MPNGKSSYFILMDFSFSNSIFFFSNSYANALLYIFSINHGPRNLCIFIAQPMILFDNSLISSVFISFRAFAISLRFSRRSFYKLSGIPLRREAVQKNRKRFCGFSPSIKKKLTLRILCIIFYRNQSLPPGFKNQPAKIRKHVFKNFFSV